MTVGGKIIHLISLGGVLHLMGVHGCAYFPWGKVLHCLWRAEIIHFIAHGGIFLYFGVLWFTEKELWVIYVLFYTLYIFIHCNDTGGIMYVFSIFM